MVDEFRFHGSAKHIEKLAETSDKETSERARKLFEEFRLIVEADRNVRTEESVKDELLTRMNKLITEVANR